MNVTRTIGAILIILLGLFIVVMNWYCVIVSMRNKSKGINKHQSTVPLISFLLSAVAYALYPFIPKWWIGIIPAIDIGNWTLIVGLPWAIAKGAFNKETPNWPSDRTR